MASLPAVELTEGGGNWVGEQAVLAHMAWLPPRRWCEAPGFQEEGWLLPLERSHHGADWYNTGKWEEDDFLWV